ncbi:unnamed protein product [Cylindrotheca closterium]|uniref:BTB domain-containing protein n=1 Tax=Cylindrotheca closterium TaxID=2856 RepID=A0AAD2FMG2_9STRA|nr:unnamed protein product [Cylindrotheca closterium]
MRGLRASAPAFVPQIDPESYWSKNGDSKNTDSSKRTNHLKQKLDDNSRARRQTGRGRGTRKGKDTKIAVQNEDESRGSLSIESNQKGGNRRKRRNKRNRLGQKRKSTREQSSLHHRSYPDIPANPLQSENVFPSLGNAVHESKTSSVWKLTSSNHLIFQPFDEAPNNTENNVDEFERLGLQRLSSSQMNESISTSNETKRNPMHSQFSEPMLATDLEESTVNEGEENLEANQLPSEKQKWNMNRLRDRWWRALAMQRLHRKLMDELKQQFADQCRETEDDCETSDSDSGCYLEPVELSSMNQPKSREPSVPSTIVNEINKQDLGGSFSSPTEAVLNAIRMNDETVLHAILHQSKPSDHSADEMDNRFRSIAQEALFACLEQDKPHLLRTILRYTSTSSYTRLMKKHEATESQVSHLMIASELGHSQCIAVLLSEEERHKCSLPSRDMDGNNVFHYCCRGRGDEASLRTLLKELSNGTKWKQQVLSKLLLLRNKEGKTSLHVACEKGREDFVSTFLSLCTNSLLSKMLSITDVYDQTPLLAAVASNSTDVVTCLIMWRGNNNRNLWKKASQIPCGNTQPSSRLVENRQESGSPPCALLWAAKTGVINMIHVLLQFSSVSGSDYRVTEALAAVIQSKASDEDKSESARILILAGGNAFAGSIQMPSDSASSTTPIGVASSYGSARILQTLVQVGREELKAKQELRRRDPKLQQQPESFFRGIETAENSQMKSALTNALIESLFYGWQYQETNLSVQHLSSAVALYKLGAQLGYSDVERLWKSMQCKSIQLDARSTDVNMSRCFATSYLHHNLEMNSKPTKVSDIDRSMLSGHSMLLSGFEWLIDQLGRFGCNCAWMARRSNVDIKTENNWHGDDKVFLVIRGGEKFLVHASIVSLKSEKLASAIRFASMNDDPDDTERIPEVFVDIDGRMLRYMLQHIYHGSVFAGWPSNEDEIFRDLLDLMVVAEEALCPSLLQECEMRLLSSNPTRCFCWSCSKAVRSSLLNYWQAAECMYLTEGFGLLVTGSRALDVLAITEFVSGFELEYSIRIAPIPYPNTRYIPASEAWGKFDETWKTARAIRLLKDQATMIILLRFRTVIESVSFQESVQYNADPTSSLNLLSHQRLLLQTCLEELPQSFML